VSLVQLFDHTKEALAAANVTAQVAFGEREIAKQVNQGSGRGNRVVFAPGDEGGALGGYDAPVKPGRNPRSLWDWMLLFRVYIWAYDLSAPEEELKQWAAVVELHDHVVEAIHPFVAAFYKPSGSKILNKPTERRFGQEILLLAEMRQPVLATPRPRTGPLVGQGQTMLVNPATGNAEVGC
jgi:hypothetical protein